MLEVSSLFHVTLQAAQTDALRKICNETKILGTKEKSLFSIN